jgi:hypothetical protein
MGWHTEKIPPERLFADCGEPSIDVCPLCDKALCRACAERPLLEDDLEFPPNALLRMLTLPVPRDVNAILFFNGFLFRQK